MPSNSNDNEVTQRRNQAQEPVLGELHRASSSMVQVPPNSMIQQSSMAQTLISQTSVPFCSALTPFPLSTRLSQHLLALQPLTAPTRNHILPPLHLLPLAVTSAPSFATAARLPRAPLPHLSTLHHLHSRSPPSRYKSQQNVPHHVTRYKLSPAQTLIQAPTTSPPRRKRE